MKLGKPEYRPRLMNLDDHEIIRSGLRAMIEAGVRILLEGAKSEVSTLLHRLDKAHTKEGIKSVEAAADLGLELIEIR